MDENTVMINNKNSDPFTDNVIKKKRKKILTPAVKAAHAAVVLLRDNLASIIFCWQLLLSRPHL